MTKMKMASTEFTEFSQEIMKGVPEKLKCDCFNTADKIIKHPAFGNEYPWSSDDFELGFPMGRGKFGRVYCAREKKTGHIVALKILFKSEITQYKIERQVLREIEIQSHLKHMRILRMLTWFHDDVRIYIVLEYASGGELYTHLKNAPNSRFSEKVAAKYTYQIASALHYCHKKNVMHRDLKPENILVTKDKNLKLADFGWSVHAPSARRKTICGTLDYLPPEMVIGKTYDIAVDIWCLGILCYEFLVGNPPFESDDRQQTYDKILAVKVYYPPFMPPGGKDLISKLLVRDSAERLSLPNVMEHPWIKEHKDEIIHAIR